MLPALRHAVAPPPAHSQTRARADHETAEGQQEEEEQQEQEEEEEEQGEEEGPTTEAGSLGAASVEAALAALGCDGSTVFRYPPAPAASGNGPATGDDDAVPWLSHAQPLQVEANTMIVMEAREPSGGDGGTETPPVRCCAAVTLRHFVRQSAIMHYGWYREH